MIRFSEGLRQAGRKWNEDASASRDPSVLKGAVRVEARLVENTRSEAKARHFAWIADETAEHGGTDQGPNPLTYFISSYAFCLQSHYAAKAAVLGLSLESLGMTVRGRFSRVHPRIFEEIIYETRIESGEPEERIRDLVNQCERDCYVTNTLKKACPLHGTIVLNGSQLMTVTHEAHT